MKALLLVTITSALLCFSFCSNKKMPPSQTKGFAVVELFTSEGCSSCPPAEELMEQINKDYADKNVLVLSYHVDYWDRLGWKDHFSSAVNTGRQNYYADIFHLSSVYTPQSVVNGQSEFVGSDRSKLEKALQHSPTNRSFDIATKQQENKIQVAVDNASLKSNEIVLIALVQKEAVAQVKSGENGGKTLHHINIVREFKILSDNSKEASFDLDKKDNERYFIAAIIQNKKSGAILGYKTITSNFGS